VKMHRATGQSEDTQWFDYRSAFFAPVVRIEWDKGTMVAALPADAVGYLVNNGYASLMTEAEIEAYTAPAKNPSEAPADADDAPTARRKKEKTS